MNEYAIKKFEEYFPNRGQQLETELYEYVISVTPGKHGLDFIKFRQNYKYVLGDILENLVYSFENNAKNLLIDIINKDSLSAALLTDPKLFAPCLYEDFQSSSYEVENEILREGHYKCSKCAHNNEYSYNTSHYDKQTRSGDEVSTIFVNCYTCGSKWRINN